MKKILNFGSLNVDYVYTTDHIVRGGETTAGTGMEIFPGGKGLNQSIALSRAGLTVHHAGLIGDDGDMLLETLRENGVDTRFVQKIEGRGGHTIIQVDKNAQNAILLFGGSNRAITPAYADAVLENFAAGDLLLLQNEISALPYIIDRAFARGMEIWLNPSPMDDGITACDLTKISGFFLNEIEGCELTGSDDPETILCRMQEKFPTAAVVLTLGENGAWFSENGAHTFCPAEKANAVDTTAAGDTFTGYFLRGKLDGLSAKASLQLAAKAAAVTVSRPGAAPSIPNYEEINM